MKIRAAFLSMAITAAVAAPMVAQTHVSECEPVDRIVTAIGTFPNVIYLDDRGYEDTSLLPPEVSGPLGDVAGQSPYGRIPALSNTNDNTNGGVWMYLENGAEEGLQVSENHVVLGENSNIVIGSFADPCYGFEGKAKNTHPLEKADLIIF